MRTTPFSRITETILPCWTSSITSPCASTTSRPRGAATSWPSAELGYGEPYRGPDLFEWEDLRSRRRATTGPRHGTCTSRSWPSSREQVDAWWSADDGRRPSGRRRARPAAAILADYYGAFVRDPDGNSLEAVHHAAAARRREPARPSLDPRPRPDRVAALLRDRGAHGRTTSARRRRTPLPCQERQAFLRVGAGRAGDRERAPRVPGGRPGDRRVLPLRGVDAGFRDNGGPGERPEYHAGYYGAFVLDPDGNNIEAVFHDR